MADVVIRRDGPDDRALIMKTWYNQLRRHGPRWMIAQPVGKHRREGDPVGVGPDYMPPVFFNATIRKRIDDLLTSEGADVACSPDDPNLIYGFRVGTKKRTHMLFVKSTYRRFGVAKALAEVVDTPHLYTVSTPTQRRISSAGRMPDGWVYDPNGMWRDK